MRNFQDTFEVRKRSFISAFSIYMTILLMEKDFFLHSKLSARFNSIKRFKKMIRLTTFPARNLFKVPKRRQ